ncbi:MAG: helix-turn-helix domain-containing protein [Oscillospiraceae bacterium]|nr:helix-turn-helix domain-containing protein [Oscillospiraceae bacterium]
MQQAKFWQEPGQLALLRGWVRDGVSEREIARRMGLKTLGLRLWRKRYPAIGEAMALSGEMTDYQVEEALLKAAMGYRYTEEKTEQTEKGEKLVTTEKEVSPNVSAISLWLKRRKPEVWDREEEEAEEKPENNLFEALGEWEKEVLTGDALPGVQSAAEADHDLVEAD